MVGHAGSPTRSVYVDVTLTRFKVKVKVTRLLNFRQLAKPCMLAAMTAAPLRGFLVSLLFYSKKTFIYDCPKRYVKIEVTANTMYLIKYLV